MRAGTASSGRERKDASSDYRYHLLLALHLLTSVVSGCCRWGSFLLMGV